MVTHRSTNHPVRSSSTGERTGSSVPCDLWPYVLLRNFELTMCLQQTARASLCVISVSRLELVHLLRIHASGIYPDETQVFFTTLLTTTPPNVLTISFRTCAHSHPSCKHWALADACDEAGMGHHRSVVQRLRVPARFTISSARARHRKTRQQPPTKIIPILKPNR